MSSRATLIKEWLFFLPLKKWDCALIACEGAKGQSRVKGVLFDCP